MPAWLNRTYLEQRNAEPQTHKTGVDAHLDTIVELTHEVQDAVELLPEDASNIKQNVAVMLMAVLDRILQIRTELLRLVKL